MQLNIGRNIRGLVATLLVLASGTLQAAYPERPIRLVVPSGAGGVTDSLARALAQIMSTNMGQQVYVDNRAGASGIIGSQAVATSAPDGYTLLMVFPSHVVNPSLFKSIPYDTVKSFAPVTLVSNVSMVFVVNKDLPVNNMKEFISFAKANPGKLNFATVGAGSLGHLGAETFNTMANTKIVHVPYKGSPQALSALLAGEVQMYVVASASSVVPHIRSNKLKALGVSVDTRLSVLPQVPTVAETLQGFEVGGWNGILAPAGTPDAVINRLQQEVAKAVRSPQLKKILENEGAIGVANTPAEFEKVIQRDIDRWAKLLMEMGVQKE